MWVYVKQTNPANREWFIYDSNSNELVAKTYSQTWAILTAYLINKFEKELFEEVSNG